VRKLFFAGAALMCLCSAALTRAAVIFTDSFTFNEIPYSYTWQMTNFAAVLPGPPGALT